MTKSQAAISVWDKCATAKGRASSLRARSAKFIVPSGGFRVPIEVLVRADIKKLDHVPPLVELVGQQEPKRTQLEPQDPDPLERSRLHLTDEWGSRRFS